MISATAGSIIAARLITVTTLPAARSWLASACMTQLAEVAKDLTLRRRPELVHRHALGARLLRNVGRLPRVVSDADNCVTGVYRFPYRRSRSRYRPSPRDGRRLPNRVGRLSCFGHRGEVFAGGQVRPDVIPGPQCRPAIATCGAGAARRGPAAQRSSSDRAIVTFSRTAGRVAALRVLPKALPRPMRLVERRR